MKNRDILKEAIADAKAVKETAIANAKLSIEEAFAPHVSKMISSKLEEIEELDEMETDENDELSLDEILEDDSIEEVKDEDDAKEKKEDKEKDEDEEDEEEEDEESEDVDIEDMTEADLRDFVEEIVKDMAANGEITPDEVMDNEMPGLEDEGAEADEDIDIEELLAEIEGDDVNEYKSEHDEYYELAIKYCQDHPEEAMCADLNVNEINKKAMKPFNEVKNKKALKPFNEAKKSDELNEAYDTIKILSSNLKEINLLNAKLLYVNKIFKAKDLNEAQKVKVLDNFDKTTSIKEVKLVYETMIGSLNARKAPIRESFMKPASSIIGSTVTKPTIIESNDQFARWKKIAGL